MTHHPGCQPPSTSLLILLTANLVASILHFGDNMLRFEAYPEPKWIAGPHVVDALWLAITPLLALGWWLARRGQKWGSVGLLWAYAVASLFVLGHYRYASPMDLSLRINALIVGEALAAAVLIVCAPLVIHWNRQSIQRS
jgi:hypothetical protein